MVMINGGFMKYTKYNVHTGVKKLWSRASKLSATSIGIAAGMLGVTVAVPVLTMALKPPKPPVVSTVVVTPQALDNTSSSPAVVRADGQNKWFLYNDTTDQVDNSIGTFVNGPGSPTNGDGSVQFTLGASPNDRKNVATYQFAGTPLASITKLGFVAYSHSGVASSTESPYLNFNVDFTGSGTNFQKRLVYVPSANGTVPQDTWNTYDAMNGGNALWNWSGYAGNGNKWPDGNTNENRTWSDIIASFPGVRVNPADSWLGVRVGEPGPTGYTGNVDSLTFGTATAETTFDFEAINQPTKNADCNNEVWKTYNAPTFTSEKECKQWVHRFVQGHLWLMNSRQEIEFNSSNVAEQATRKNPTYGQVHYINRDYAEAGEPGYLEYTTDIICTNSDPSTNHARFAFQIPEGHPGLTGLYVVVDVNKGRHGESLYGQAVTSDRNTAMQWCQTGEGFSPTFYDVNRGFVNVNNN